MWVEGGDIQDELLDQLGALLTAPDDLALTPSAIEFEALAAAVAARWPDGAAAPADGESIAERAASVHQLRSTGRRPLRRLGSSAWRAGSVAAGIVLFSASAAAANGGVPLPRPVRMVAYTVGLPVDSPALDTTNRHVEELKKAVKANDKPKAQATARRLQSDLTKVPGHEKEEAEQKVVAVMAIAEPLIVAPSPTTTSTAPPTSTTATTAASPTTATTAEAEEKEREKDKDKDSKVPASTTTTASATTTTTEPETTTTSTAPATDETPSDGSGTPSGEPGTGSGDPGAGGAGTGGGDPGSTTPTTIPDGETTTTTSPDGGGASGGDDPGSTTTTTSSTTTTTMPPPDPGASAASNSPRGPRHYRQ